MVKVIFFFLTSLLLFQCGLPTSADVNLNQLNKPVVVVYNKINSIVFEISSYYPSSDYPNFQGYNIYIGDNNDSKEIIKRVLFLDHEDRLPTKDAQTTTEGSINTRVEITEFKFRFTAKATDDDLSIANVSSRKILLKRDFSFSEKYYFIVKAKEVSREGIASDNEQLVFVDYKEDEILPYGNLGRINGTDNFSALQVNGTKLYPNNIDGNSYTLKISAMGFKANIFEYHGIPRDEIFQDTFFPSLVSNLYFIQAISSDKSKKEYFKILIHEINASQMKISYGYQKEVITDLNLNLK